MPAQLKDVLILVAGLPLGAISLKYLTQPQRTFQKVLEEQARVPLLAWLNPFRFAALQPLGIVSVWITGLLGAIISLLCIVLGAGALLGRWNLE